MNFVVTILAICCSFTRLLESDDEHDQRLIRNALSSHAVESSELAQIRRVADLTLGKAARTQDLQWSGVNIDSGWKGVSLYFVSAPTLVIDKRVCPVVNAPTVECAAATRVLNNCAVVAKNTIACDLRVLWTIERDAYRLALSSLVNPETKAYYFPRDELRRKFLAREQALQTELAMIENLHEIHASLAIGAASAVADVADRVRQGFVKFLLLHEFGHVVSGHLGEGLPNCQRKAITPQPCRVCASAAGFEVEADAFAIHALSGELTQDKFTPARAIPEYWMEQFQRTAFSAVLRAGFSPDWSATSGSPEEQLRYRDYLFDAMATCDHPAWLGRYLSMMVALRVAGIQLPNSQTSLDNANALIEAARRFCQTSCPLSQE